MTLQGYTLSQLVVRFWFVFLDSFSKFLHFVHELDEALLGGGIQVLEDLLVHIKIGFDDVFLLSLNQLLILIVLIKERVLVQVQLGKVGEYFVTRFSSNLLCYQ